MLWLVVVVAYQLKEASVKDAKETPATIGNKEQTIHKLGHWHSTGYISKK